MRAITRSLAVVGALALGFGGALVVAAPANAASFSVTTLNDSGPGSLRQALLDSVAPGPDTITFGSGLTGTIALTTVLPDITDDLTIVGPGEAAMTVDSPDTVFTIQGGAPNISVAISGITITSAGTTACGILADNANLTLQNVTASNFACSGVSVADGSLSATDVTVEDDATGIAFTGTDPTHSLTLVRVHAAGAALMGVYAVVQGGVATITDVDADDSAFFGVNVATSNGGTSTISGVRADRASIIGIAVLASGSSTVTLSDSSAADSGGQGINLQSTDSSTLTALRVTSARSASTGLWLSTTLSATLSVQSSTVSDTVDNSGVWVDQIATGAALTIAGSTITGNYSNDDGGGIDVNTLQDDGSSLTISDSTISGNESGDFGGGVYLRQPAQPGPSTAKVTIVRTTIDGNFSGGYGAGIAIDDPGDETTGLPTVLIDSTTLSNNETPAGGGGLYISKLNGAGAIVKVLNSTVAGNLAQAGGAVYIEGIAAQVTIFSSSTLAGNIAHTSGGIEDNNAGDDLRLENSIVSGATSDNGGTPDDLSTFGSVTARYSLVQNPGVGVVVSGPGVITGISPQLGALADNGGPTRTMLVTPGSPAYNAGDPAITGAGLFDQRGQPRVYQRIDVGAVEWQPALARTGVTAPEPEQPLIALLLILGGVAMVAFSRLRSARSVS